MALQILRRSAPAILTGLVLLAGAYDAPADAQADSKKSKPSITVKSTPVVGFSPARMVVTAELRGGDDDYQDFYCATVEWDWGDDTRSQAGADCEPYEAGKSSIKRRFTIDHVFETAGDYRVEFRLKQKNKVVARGTTEVKIRPGIRDGGDLQ
jgi:plastocyanin